MKKRFLPLSMLLITMVLAQASLVANAAEIGGKYTPRSESNATISSFWKSIRANQETGLIDPALLMAGRQTTQSPRNITETDWTPAGPDNYGGETKAVIYDKDGNVLIGTIGGNIYKTTNDGITFQFVKHIPASISCFAMKNNVLYIGTGDGLDAQNTNGLSDLGYSTSFVGNGIYKLEGNDAVLVSGTEGIEFVNEMTVVGNDIYAATSAGLIVINSGISTAIEGEFRSVKSNKNGDILAADSKDVYLKKVDGEFEKITGTDILPSGTDTKIIAMSENDKNYMYIAVIKKVSDNNYTGNIYFTANNAKTWKIAYTNVGTDMYAILGSDAAHSSFAVVHPNNPRKIFIGSDNLWVLENSTGDTINNNSYRPMQISEYNIGMYEAIVAWNRYYYLHMGIQNIVFNNDNPNIFYIGTEGGIFKGEYAQSLYSYKTGNRYFETETRHMSPARMMSVAVGGGTKIIGGSLDHGTIMMLADDTIDNVTTGKAILPNPTATNNTFGYFTKDYSGGPCFISTIKPDILIASTTGAIEMPIKRSETNGEDYDLTKFSAQGVIKNSDAFRTPFTVFETYNDTHTSVEVYDILDSVAQPLDTMYVHLGDTIFVNEEVHITQGHIWVADTTYTLSHITINDTLWSVNDTSVYVYDVLHNVMDTVTINFDTLLLAIRRPAKANEIVHYYSNQGGYPLDYKLPEPPHDSIHWDTLDKVYKWIQGDTIRGLHDPLKTNMVVGIKNKVYMTRDALIFNKDTEWFLISSISGIPSAVAMTADGMDAFVGTVAGKYYKFSNVGEAFTAEQADVTNTLNPCVEMYSDLTTFAGRAITSISVNPNNNNEVIVTLGNYGNDDYVYRSLDGGLTFASIQGNLPKVPVYSSIVELSGLYMLGTEHGVYTSTNGATWTPQEGIDCPVMGLTQAILDNHDDVTDVLYDEMGDATYIVYPGIHNQGVIYAATYGNGILKNEKYLTDADFGVDEVMAETSYAQIYVYPNPVRCDAQFSFTMTEGANVRYQIFDLAGRMVENNELGFYGAGDHTATINTANLPSGSYIIRVLAGNTMNTGKFLVY